ncbi:hypothetical protein ACFPK9_11705 [Rubritalea spongiae]|uniref:DUF5666 domain-containing protein n=1 Tax=Rubritalea spongiae TaxID=430797 RepID=A0ABW5E4F4_9BACT
MKNPFLKFLACTLAIAFTTHSDALAKPKRKKNKKKRPATKSGHASELPTIENLGKNQLNSNGKLYFVDERTDIFVDGEDSEFADLQEGMQVSISSRVKEYGRNGEQTTYLATRISARENKEMKSDKNAKNSNKKNTRR